MDYGEYVQGVSFRFLTTSTARPRGLRELGRWLRPCGVHLDALNTRLPERDVLTKRRLRRVCRLPRMSTFAVGALIHRAVSDMPDDQSFVNVGVWHGFTLFCGLTGHAQKRCIGVDDFSHKDSPRERFLRRFARFGSPGHQFYEMDYRDYFARVHQGPIGVYMFDGPHTYEDQWEGLRLAEPFFAPGCIILIDDTNWPQVRRATDDFLQCRPDSYRVLLDRPTPKNGHPTYWNGLIVLQRAEPGQPAYEKSTSRSSTESSVSRLWSASRMASASERF